MKVGVAAVSGCFDSAVTAVLDVLRTANAARSLVDPHLPQMDVTLLGTSPDAVRTAGGLLLPVDELLDEATVDVLVVPALGTNTPEAVTDALQRDDVRKLRSHLIRWRADSTTELAAACTGTFVLADAGLLDGRRATTSWWLTGEFTRRFPGVQLDMSRMVVRDGNTTTAGAAFAHIDLAMSLVSRVSPQLADFTARTLLIDDRPSRSLETALGYLSSADQLVTDFEAWARANLHRDITVAEGAEAIGTNRRTLERRLRLRLGMTPHAVIRRLRVEQASHLRRTSDLSLTQIAARVGYRNPSSLRAALGPRQR